MTSKALLNLELNYTHKSLSPASRYVSVFVGLLLIIVGTYAFLNNNISRPEIVFSLVVNIILGIFFIGFSLPFIPKIARKNIVITDEDFTYKLMEFMPKKGFKWDEVEEVEIDSSRLKVRLEYETSIRTIPLVRVAYSDYELLQKTIIDTCVKKNIDLK